MLAFWNRHLWIFAAAAGVTILVAGGAVTVQPHHYLAGTVLTVAGCGLWALGWVLYTDRRNREQRDWWWEDGRRTGREEAVNIAASAQFQRGAA